MEWENQSLGSLCLLVQIGRQTFILQIHESGFACLNLTLASVQTKKYKMISFNDLEVEFWSHFSLKAVSMFNLVKISSKYRWCIIGLQVNNSITFELVFLRLQFDSSHPRVTHDLKWLLLRKRITSLNFPFDTMLWLFYRRETRNSKYWRWITT